MIKEVNRGEGLTQLLDWPETMEVKHIHIRKKHKVEESPLDDVLFLVGLFLFVILFCFAVPLVQHSELLYMLMLAVAVGCLMTVAYRSGKKRGR